MDERSASKPLPARPQPPSDGYKKLEDADSLDLACETRVADATKP